MKPVETAGWLASLPERVAEYMRSLEVPASPGRFLPCLQGATPEGKQIALGFSCFALKIYYALRLWENLAPEIQKAWIDYLNSFQVDGESERARIARNAFIDPAVFRYLASHTPWHRWLIAPVFFPRFMTELDRAIIAETKQAIATLAQVGESARRPYCAFPATPTGVKHYLLRLDWAKPWGAGGQAAALVVLLKTQRPAGANQSALHGLLSACASVFEGLADARTGAYFRGPVPQYAELINGAMKVLTALDWLDRPIHYPERLIETCLTLLPLTEGCHVVDAIYVLHRCSKQTQYKREEVLAYCVQVLEMIKQHHNADGGFSYNVGCSQTSYYGVPISRGLAESDIHGTCLLTWAVTMISDLLYEGETRWRVIRP